MAPNSTQDRLSNLPDSLIENILSRLAIREVVKTSTVLSTKWRYKWTSIPHLLFNDECIPAGLDGSAGHDKLVKIVNHVLLTHTRPIFSFRICSSHFLQSCSDINNWVFSLSLLSLTKFELQIAPLNRRHKVLPSLYSFKYLSRLTLVGCRIPVPPSSFGGFSSLRTLFLERVKLSCAALKFLLSSSPKLRNLKLIDLHVLTGIEASNRKLKYLRIYICRRSVEIGLLDFKLLVNANYLATYTSTLSCRKNLLGIHELYLETCLLMSFSRPVPEGLSSTFHHLKRVSFLINPRFYLNQILFALYLLHHLKSLKLSFVVLKNIHGIIICMQRIEDRLKNTTFNTLRVVKFSGFSGLDFQFLLVEHLLANTPVLETMEIHSSTKDSSEQLTFGKELLQFKRTSPQARIMYH